MSVSVDSPTTSAPDRSVIATRQLCDALALGTLKPKDLKHLTVALAEAGAEEVSHNDAFRRHVLSVFQELSASQKAPATSGKKTREKPAKPQLTPIRTVDPKLLGPDKPLDPYLVQYAYGDDQLRLFLEQVPPGELNKAAVLVEQRNPGTKPANRSQKAALIEYIVSHLIR